jgi:hypothetical protein
MRQPRPRLAADSTPLLRRGPVGIAIRLFELSHPAPARFSFFIDELNPKIALACSIPAR